VLLYHSTTPVIQITQSIRLLSKHSSRMDYPVQEKDQRAIENRRKCTDRRRSNPDEDILYYTKPNRRSMLDRRSGNDRRMGNY
jgi:hypothetical protein